MIGHSIPEYIFIRICIAGLRLVAPLSILYVVTSLYVGRWLFTRWLGYYAVVEALFYLLVYLPRDRYLQRVSISFISSHPVIVAGVLNFEII